MPVNEADREAIVAEEQSPTEERLTSPNPTLIDRKDTPDLEKGEGGSS